MKRGIRAKWVSALLIAGLGLGLGTITAGNEKKTDKHKKSPVSKEDRKAIDKIWKEFQDATSGKKGGSSKEDVEVIVRARIRLLKDKELEEAKRRLGFEDAPNTQTPPGDYFLTWPPKGQGPMPRLDRPTDLP